MIRLSPLEDQIQASLIDTLRYRARQEIVYFAVPNGGLRTSRVAQRMKATGTTPGIPDLIFAMEQGRTFWLELKTKTGSLSDVQRGIKFKLEALRHDWAMARSVDEAMELLAQRGVLK